MSQKFIEKLSPEKKKMRELKFQLYTHGSDHQESTTGWASLILDKNENKTFLCGEEHFDNPNRVHLYSIIEGLNWIYNQVDQRYRQYIVVNLFSDSVYCVNILKEWLQKWIEEGEEKVLERPNGDLMISLHDLLKVIKIHPKWTSKTQSEYAWMVAKKANEQA
jgi:ribonuclease HI